MHQTPSSPGPDAASPCPSPCTGICVLAPATGYCIGCLRTGDEIAGWMGMGEAQRRRVLEALAARRAAGVDQRTPRA